MKLMITKSRLGFSVYDADKLDRLDLFPNDREGRMRLVDFLSKFVYSQPSKTRRTKKKG